METLIEICCELIHFVMNVMTTAAGNYTEWWNLIIIKCSENGHKTIVSFYPVCIHFTFDGHRELQMLSSILQNQTFEVKHGNDAMTYLIDKRTQNGYPMLHNRDNNRDHSIRDLTYITLFKHNFQRNIHIQRIYKLIQ